MSTPGTSPHPTDRLIRELITTERSATADARRQIIERMASAGFNSQPVRVPARDRGASYQRRTLGAREPSLVYHLVKRVVIEQQWANGTTAQDYLADLQRSVLHPRARLVAYQRGREHFAATITPTEIILPPERRGPTLLPNLLVVYSADQGIISTGYQFSDLSQLDVPEGARWLS